MSIQAIVTLSKERYEKTSNRKQKSALRIFRDRYPSLREKEPGDTFYLWYYVQYMIGDYQPVTVTLPNEVTGPFNAVYTDFIALEDEETGEEEEDFWSVDLSIIVSSVERLAECADEAVTTALQEKILKHLKAIRYVKKHEGDEFPFTAIDLVKATALAMYELINPPVPRVLDVKEIGTIYRAYMAEDKRIAREEDVDQHGHTFTWCIYGLEWVKEHFFPEEKIMGFHSDDNPQASLGVGEDGFDFLLVGERYLFNFWSRTVAGDRKVPIVVDRQTQPELARELYGNPETWEEIC